MAADVFSLGETWLEPGDTANFEGYIGSFANYGKGKGVSVFSKIDCYQMNKVTCTTYSAIHIRTNKFDAIFLYLSSDCNKEEISSTLEAWIDDDTPTAIIGDVNIDYSNSSKLIKFMEKKGFEQMIKKATCDTGSLIDHIYISKSLQELEIFIDQSAAYYSDHDIVTLYVKK